MKTNYFLRLAQLCFLIILTSCSKGPKIITASSDNTAEGTGILSEENPFPVLTDLPKSSNTNVEDVHTVTIIEALPTTRYVYLRVKEGQEEFWIATSKMEVTIGGTYFYRDGLLKTNFESKEHNRVFEKMYLVSSVVEADHALRTAQTPTEVVTTKNKANVSVKGSVKIADLVADPKKYSGKTIQISGQCTKVNPNIMGRNWMHLKDGSKDDFDLVITSSVLIPEGHTVTMVGKVVLNKDFGSGYKYAILIEEGEIVK
ncbi:MAG: GW dipeptide domain-containing protein [Cyclobacteriaceae bacterium]